MATIGETLRDIMFAGIGAVAITAEKGKEVIVLEKLHLQLLLVL